MVCGQWRSRGHGGRGPKWDREFTLAEVERLDVDALRVGDGFDHRYYQGGRITWFSPRSGEELEVKQLTGLPQDSWRHLEGCACPSCTPVAAPSADQPQRGSTASDAGRGATPRTPQAETFDTSPVPSLRPGQRAPHLSNGEEKE